MREEDILMRIKIAQYQLMIELLPENLNQKFSCLNYWINIVQKNIY